MKENKLVKLIIGISAAVALVGLVVVAYILFRQEIKEIFITVREWFYTVKNNAAECCGKACKKNRYTTEECRHFADI